MLFEADHTIMVTQSVIRLVTCEECDTEFIYVLERSGSDTKTSHWITDEGKAEKRAEREARKKLAEELKYSCEAVPCPEYAHVQDHMIGQAKADKARLWYGLSIAALVVGFLLVLLMLWLQFQTGAIATGLLFGLAAAVFGGVGFLLYTTHEPNKVSEEERFKVAEEKAARRKDFEAAVVETTNDEFEKYLDKLERKKKVKKVFDVPVWVDRDQVRDEESVKIRLPNNERISMRLDAKSGDGDGFEVERTVEGHDVRFKCVLRVYTVTRKKK